MTNIDTNIRVVLFDHDDTLVGTIDPKWKHHKFVAKKYYNKELTDAEIAKHWGKPFEELLCTLYGTDDVEKAVKLNTACRDDFPKDLFTTTVPALQKLKNKDILIGVMTATARFSFEHDLKQHNFPLGLFDYVQTAEDTNAHKPDPRVFDPVMQWLASKSIKPAEVLYVGDGLHDMKASLGAGFKFIGVETGLVKAEEFKSAGVVSVRDLAMLTEGS